MFHADLNYLRKNSKDLKNQSRISLGNNKLTSLDAKIFENLKNLNELWLNDNQLTSLDAKIFNGLNNLNTLWLCYNELTSLNGKIFNDLNNLSRLSLRNNQLTSLDPNIFNGLNSLTELNLSANKLTSLDPYIFDDLNNLCYLLLYNNKLVSLDCKTFNCLPKLNTLLLNENFLIALDAITFNGLKNLNRLSIGDNQLTSLDAKIFNGLNSLTDLNLSGNKLTSLDSKIFDGLNNIKRLFINNNALISIDSNTFNGLNNLSKLSLDNNQLTSLDPKIFNGLNSLTELNLSANKLVSLDPNLFNGLNKLETIYLHQNKLTNLEFNMFCDLKKITIISLYKNDSIFMSFFPDINTNDFIFDKNQSFTNDLSEFIQQRPEEKSVSRQSKTESRLFGKTFEAVEKSKPKFPQLEADMVNWINSQRAEGKCVSRKMIQDHAKSISTSDEFKESNEWLGDFLSRNRFVRRRVTTSYGEPPRDSPILMKQFIDKCKKYRVRDFDLRTLVNMDETTIYFDPPTNHTIEKSESERVQSSNSGAEKVRVSILIAATASGHKLNPIILIPRKKPLKDFVPPDNVKVVYGTSGTFNSTIINDEFIERVLVNYKQSIGATRLYLVIDQATCHTSGNVIESIIKHQIDVTFIPKRLTNMLQPADVSWKRSLKVAYYSLWKDWLKNSPQSYTANGDVKSPGYKNVIKWISSIWENFDRNVIIDSFNICGISSDNHRSYHRQLKHFVNTNELIEDIVVGDDLDDLDGFNIEEEDFYDSDHGDSKDFDDDDDD